MEQKATLLLVDDMPPVREAQGGRILAEENTPQGAVFTVELTCEPAAGAGVPAQT